VWGTWGNRADAFAEVTMLLLKGAIVGTGPHAERYQDFRGGTPEKNVFAEVRKSLPLPNNLAMHDSRALSNFHHPPLLF
jgi:hypothetical protein